MVDSLCNDAEFCFDIKLKPGDMEIANNATTFHSRENYQDYELLYSGSYQVVGVNRVLQPELYLYIKLQFDLH